MYNVYRTTCTLSVQWVNVYSVYRTTMCTKCTVNVYNVYRTTMYTECTVGVYNVYRTTCTLSVQWVNVYNVYRTTMCTKCTVNVYNVYRTTCTLSVQWVNVYNVYRTTWRHYTWRHTAATSDLLKYCWKITAPLTPKQWYVCLSVCLSVSLCLAVCVIDEDQDDSVDLTALNQWRRSSWVDDNITSVITHTVTPSSLHLVDTDVCPCHV